MALEPITRKEKIIAGENLEPITRMEQFLKKFGGSGGGGGGGATTLHINVTAVNRETMEATFTADKTPSEMEQASVNGPIWCVVSFEAGTMVEAAVSVGVPPTWFSGVAFGKAVWELHDQDGNNKISCAVARWTSDTWKLNLEAFMS